METGAHNFLQIVRRGPYQVQGWVVRQADSVIRWIVIFNLCKIVVKNVEICDLAIVLNILQSSIYKYLSKIYPSLIRGKSNKDFKNFTIHWIALFTF